ncbi:MAG TPA: hypothetical protein VGK58_10860 [Lacipirellulaceae bacterium]
MPFDDIWPDHSRVIEFDAPNGTLGESLRAAGFAKHLIVVRDESRRRAIVRTFPSLGSSIALRVSPRVVRQNNADVLILHRWSALRVCRWRNVRHARYVVLPWTGSPLCWFAVLIWFWQWALGRLAWPRFVCVKRIVQDRQGRRVLGPRLVVCRVRRPRPQQGARRYIPHALGIEGFLRRVETGGVRHAVLRWFEQLPQLPGGEDIDLLVDDAGLESVHAMLDAGPGIQPIDVYSVTGLPGADYRAMPYYPPYLAERLLDRAARHRHMCHVPAPREHFLSLAYHALYHKGVEAGIPSRLGTPINSRSDHNYSVVLGRLAHELGIDVPVTLEDLDGYLDSQGWRPPHDMLVRLARHNRWVRSLLRQPEKLPAADDRLAVFLVREEALRRGGIERAAKLIESYGFDVVASRRIDASASTRVARSIRGGNWGRGPWPISGGPPIAAIVAFDRAPIPLTRRQRRRFPFVANARLLCKEQLRDAFNHGVAADQHCNVVHSSDNGREAMDYLRIIMPDAIDCVLAAISPATGEIRRAA